MRDAGQASSPTSVTTRPASRRPARRCGECYRACPMVPRTPALATAAPEAVMAGIRDILRDGAGTADAIAFAGACTRSGVCTPACPEKLDAAFLMRLASLRVRGTLGDPPRVAAKHDPNWSVAREGVRAADHERGGAGHMAVTPDASVTFWYGCNMARHGEIVRLVTRILEAIGVAAAPAGGPGYCCGSPQEKNARIAAGMAARTVEKFNQAGRETVVTWCPSCHMNMDDLMAPVTETAFDTQHITQLLVGACRTAASVC